MDETDTAQILCDIINKNSRRSFYIGYASGLLAAGTVLAIEYGFKKLHDSRMMREWRNNLTNVTTEDLFAG